MAGKRKGKEDERHLWPEMLRAIKEIQPRWVVGENVFGLVNWSNGLVFHEVQADLEAQGYEVFPYVLPACAVNAPHRRDRIWFVAYAKDRGINGINGNDNEQEGKNWTGYDKSNSIGNERTTTNPNRNGFNGSDCQHEIQPSEGGEYAQRDFEQIIINTERIGWVEERNDNGFIETPQQAKCREQQFSGANSAQDWWGNFPTQSPVRFGDDGLSSRLDNITFSKWRNESIKAAGNAIVPQVALQIFKTIQQYEKML